MTFDDAAAPPLNRDSESIERFWRQRAEGTRARILTAASLAFVELGYHGASTREIALRAGMSPSAMYVHFSSKEELLFEISRLCHEATTAALLGNLALSPVPTQSLRLGIGAFSTFQAENSELMRTVEYEYKSLSGSYRREIAAMRSHIENTLRGVLARGIESGEFVIHDLDTMVILLLSLCIDIDRWYRPDPIRTPATIGMQYADLAIRLVTT